MNSIRPDNLLLKAKLLLTDSYVMSLCFSTYSHLNIINKTLFYSLYEVSLTRIHNAHT